MVKTAVVSSESEMAEGELPPAWVMSLLLASPGFPQWQWRRPALCECLCGLWKRIMSMFAFLGDFASKSVRWTNVTILSYQNVCHLFVCEEGGWRLPWQECGSQRTTSGTEFSLSLLSLGWNLGPQAWLQVPLPTEPSCLAQPPFIKCKLSKR